MEKRSLFLAIFSCVCLVAAAAIGLGIYYGTPKPESRDEAVANCIPEGDATKEQCEERE